MKKRIWIICGIIHFCCAFSSCELYAMPLDFSALEAVVTAEKFIAMNSKCRTTRDVSEVSMALFGNENLELHAISLLSYKSHSGDEFWVIGFRGYIDGHTTPWWFLRTVFVTKTRGNRNEPKVVLLLSEPEDSLFPELSRLNDGDYLSDSCRAKLNAYLDSFYESSNPVN
jgi:hypothetical protein